MKRLDRSSALFSLSALDALACATGVFVVLIVVLMPYYHNSFDQQAALEEFRIATKANAAQLKDVQARLAEETSKAAAALAEARKVSAQAGALETQAAPTPPRRPAPEPKGQPVVEEIDLIFVVDRTVSMTPVLRQIARSMASIVEILERLVSSVRIAVVAYSDRDTGLPPLVVMPLTSTRHDLPYILRFVHELRVSPINSRTIQEDLCLGLAAAMAMPLRTAAKQVIVAIGDAASHDAEQAECLAAIQRFVAASDRRTVSALFVTTPSSLSAGNIDRRFFVQLAGAGRGAMTDHTGSMTESLLLSILVE